MTDSCNLICLEQWYFSLIWNTYIWKLQTFCIALFVRNIWYKYRLWYFKILSNFTRLTARELCFVGGQWTVFKSAGFDWLKVERKKVLSWNVVVVVMETRDISYDPLFSPTSKMTWELPTKRYLLPCFLKMYKVKHPFIIHVCLSDKYKFRHHHLTEQNGRLCYLRSTYHFS